MKIEVHVTKTRLFITLIALFAISAGILVYAYNSSPAVPSTFGHSANEIDGFPNCNAQQALTHTSSGWSCLDIQQANTPYSSSWTAVGSGGTFTFEHDLGDYKNLVGYIYAADNSAGSNPHMLYWTQWQAVYSNSCQPVSSAGGYVKSLNNTHVVVFVQSPSTTTALSSSTISKGYSYIKVVLQKASPGTVVGGGSSGDLCTGVSSGQKGTQNVWGLAGINSTKQPYCANNNTLMGFTGGDGAFFCLSGISA